MMAERVVERNRIDRLVQCCGAVSKLIVVECGGRQIRLRRRIGVSHSAVDCSRLNGLNSARGDTSMRQQSQSISMRLMLLEERGKWCW